MPRSLEHSLEIDRLVARTPVPNQSSSPSHHSGIADGCGGGARRGGYAFLFLWVWCGLCASASFAQDSNPSSASQSIFGLDNVIDVHFRVPKAEWDKMQPPEGTRLDFLSMMLAFEDVVDDSIEGKHFRSEKSTRPGLVGYMGVDHQYGMADVTVDGETVLGVGLRYKGNGTFIEGQQFGRLPFKIDFNEYDDDLKFRGLTKINFNNNASDPSLLREALSYEMFREAGIPCSRIGFARLTLTVTGEFEDKSLGLYTVVEQVDKRFLKDRYGSADGLLLKPSTFGVFRDLGDDWKEYEIGYVPKTDPTEQQKQRVIEFAKLLQHADDEKFNSQLEDYLDVDQFLRFLAVNVLLCNLDSFLGGSQNHYIYLEPESNKFQFLPWDMDHSFGAFPLEGTAHSRRNLSIDQPGGEKHRLIRRVLAIPEHKATYYSYLNQYLETSFEEEKLKRQISETADFVRPLVSINGPNALKRFDRVLADRPSGDELHPMKYFVEKRIQSVRRQLDGESAGDVMFSNQGKRFPVRRTIGFAIALVILLLLHFVGWIWGGVAGFRSGIKWGLLNLVFYPITPAIYGFGVQQALGKRAAMWVVGCVIGVVIWGVAVAITLT